MKFMKRLNLKNAYNLSLGHYIPQLAEIMLLFNKKENLFNLKGIAVSYLIFKNTFFAFKEVLKKKS